MRNTNRLRVVGTVYTIEELNTAQSSGMVCLLKEKTRNPLLETRELILRNRISSQYISVPNRTVFLQHGRGIKEYPEQEWELVLETTSYNRPSPRISKWAAYIIPSDARIGERFLIADLIEDLFAFEHFYFKRAAESAEAVWNGEDLVVDPKSYESFVVG